MSVDRGLVARATAAFEKAFGVAPDIVAYAPGRVNLIGEHTDYNDGFVLPCGIDYGTAIAAGRAHDGHVEAVAADLGNAQDRFAVEGDITARDGMEWTDHVRGIAASLKTRDHQPAGARFAIAGDVPRGAGLSSSAALGVALSLAFSKLNDFELTPTDFALIAQQSENEFVGTACGIMDQLVSARAEAGSAVLIDCRSLTTEAVSIPDDLAVLIVHSGTERELAESAYNERRRQCEAVAAHFGVAALRDVDMEMLDGAKPALDPVAYRRAKHVITENARTLAAAEAMRADDAVWMGRLMAESHASMRDDFEITVPKVDELAALAQEVIGEDGGARMTGGGFGGCVVAMFPRGGLEQVEAEIAARYQTPGGETPRMIRAIPSAGARLL